MDENLNDALKGALRQSLDTNLVGHVPPNSDLIAAWLTRLESDWQAIDFQAVYDDSSENAAAIYSCVKSGLAEVRCCIQAFDASLDRSQEFQLTATGDYVSQLGKKIQEHWPDHRNHQQSDWCYRLTAPGMQAKFEVESGSPSRRLGACQAAFYGNVEPRLTLRLTGHRKTQPSSAVAVSRSHSSIGDVSVNVSPQINFGVAVPNSPEKEPVEEDVIPAGRAASHSTRTSKERRRSKWEMFYQVVSKRVIRDRQWPVADSEDYDRVVREIMAEYQDTIEDPLTDPPSGIKETAWPRFKRSGGRTALSKAKVQIGQHPDHGKPLWSL